MFLNQKWTVVTFMLLGLQGVIQTGCQEKIKLDGKPRTVIRAYIEKSFNIKSVEDRNVLQSFLTGETKKKLEAWSDDQFQKAFVDTKRKFLKLAFKEIKPVSEKEVTVTYELTYLDKGREHEARITNKKLGYLTQIDGSWKIREVKNLKELIEFKDEMSLP